MEAVASITGAGISSMADVGLYQGTHDEIHARRAINQPYSWFMKILGIFEAKTHFTALCDEVVRTGQPTIVSKRGKPLVMVTPVLSEGGADHEDILSAWRRWEEFHPGSDAEPDFPDVISMRALPKPNPLAE